MLDAATELWGGAADSVEPEPEVTPKLVLVVGSPVGERLLRKLPHAFVGVELRSVAGKVVQVEPRESTAQGTDRLALVDGGTIPEQNHGAAEMAEQMPDELADLGMLDVLRVEAVVQAEMAAARNEFSGALRLLRGSPENTEEINQALDEVGLQWTWFENAIDLQDAESFRLVVADASESILQAMDRITALYEELASP